MGILNITPDSFSDGGKYISIDAAINRAKQIIKEGAKIIDIGGYSTRPGANVVSLQEELDRVLPIIQQITSRFDVVISVDTFRSQVAKAAVQFGASIINDISAGHDDHAMIDTVAKLGVPYIAMHKKGSPKTMQLNPTYVDVVGEVVNYLVKVKQKCDDAGIQDLIIDPGFGFGKTIQHNYVLLEHLNQFSQLNLPILVGLSLKSMIHKVLLIDPSEAQSGTTFLHAFALNGGVNILRVHHVKEAVECVKLFNYMRQIR
jgi:dihydropteroate synthase